MISLKKTPKLGGYSIGTIFGLLALGGCVSNETDQLNIGMFDGSSLVTPENPHLRNKDGQ